MEQSAMSEPSEMSAHVVMIGTSIEMKGGISTVVSILKNAGLFERCGVEYISTHRDGQFSAKLAIFIRAWLRYLKLLYSGRVAVLHAHTSFRASFWRKTLFILPTFLQRVPGILHLHSGGFQEFYEKECSVQQQRFVHWLFTRTSRVVVLSESWRQWVKSTVPLANVEIIPNPIQISVPQSEEKRLSSSLLFLGNLCKNKGVYDLLHAVKHLLPSYPNIHVLLCGDGELEAVRAQADSLKIQNHIKFLGWISGCNKLRHLKEASIYVQPSYKEGLPMSVLEAMAHGLPVVSTPVGGIPEAVSDGVEGFLVQPGDIQMLADRIARLLDDPDLRNRMGEAGRIKVEKKFSTDVILPQIERIYQDLGVGSKSA
jgi:glycosyltransferase involved in cell wall biosynthesis